MPPGRPLSAETRRRISEALMGHVVSEETRARIRETQRTSEAYARGIERLRARRGPETSNWKGDEAGYRALHKRAAKALPPDCEDCGRPPGRRRHDTALRHEAPEEHLSRSPWGVWYSVRLEDYVRLCRRCHLRYDGRVWPP